MAHYHPTENYAHVDDARRGDANVHETKVNGCVDGLSLIHI